MVNITTEFTPELIAEAHQITALPSLVMGYIATAIIFIFVGWIMIDPRKSGYGKFFTIAIISLLLIVIVFLFLAFSPNLVQTIKEFVT